MRASRSCGWREIREKEISEEQVKPLVDGIEYVESPRDLHREANGYGSYAAEIDVERVDLVEYPCYAHLPWVEATLEAGDCLFLPTGWFHSVWGDGGELRYSLAVSQMFRTPARQSWLASDDECREYIKHSAAQN